MSTERDPLLQSSVPSAAPTTLNAVSPTTNGTNGTTRYEKKGLGPLEISKTTRYGILAGIWAATFLSSLNTTLVATLLPGISSDFQKSEQASWLGTAYLLATCTFTPLYGRLCNVLGRRGANQTAVLFAALGTLACGFSTNMETLIAARFVRDYLMNTEAREMTFYLPKLAGIGGGGIFTTATIITSDMYSLRTRGLTQGVAAVFNSAGMGLGGPLGGWIADQYGWRWAFLIQMPLFLVSFILTSINLHYVTPGKGRSTKEVLKRIDYGGSITLLIAVLSFLIFLSTKYNEEYPWSDISVYLPLTLAIIFFIAFVLVELFVAPEPVLAPFLLKKKIPVLVATSNFLVATCNFAIMYNFPTWFQTVLLTSASEAGAHLIPNGISISLGSLFAGWMMHVTGRYKMLNLICGIFPFVATLLIASMKADSSWVLQWFAILPMGFGNAVVLQTVLIALLAHLPHSAMAVATGFAQLFRGVGQVSGVAVSMALFQSKLNAELHKRIKGDNAEEIIEKIRHSATLVAKLPPDLQKDAREAYATSLRSVFYMAAVFTFLAYCVRLPIPDKSLEAVRPKPAPADEERAPPTPPPPPPNPLEETEEDSEDDQDDIEDTGSGDDENEVSDQVSPSMQPVPIRRPRRLSTYESTDGVLDLESGGSARPRSLRSHMRGRTM
ncbi:MFS general substrate transporter [Panus rudis PR-1116 ss-1]|nr:MFS general substrate transporter [Panus rudis PR-1116 ss-1]